MEKVEKIIKKKRVIFSRGKRADSIILYIN